MGELIFLISMIMILGQYFNLKQYINILYIVILH